MNITDCKTLGSPTYRRLCQTLSLPPPQEGPFSRGLTGQRDTDLIILSKLSDEELINVCATNRQVNTWCNDHDFWKYRTINKFGNILGEDIKQYIPEGTAWKDYYLWLSGMQNADKKLVHELALFHNREDLLLLLDDYIQNITTPAGELPLRISYTNNKLQRFFKEGNLGPSDPANPWSTPLADVIDVRVIGTRSINALFGIYVRVNNMFTQGDDRFLRATPLMRDIFAEDFIARNLNPDRFLYSSFQMLVVMNLIPRNQLQMSTLRGPETIQYAKALDRYLRSIIDYYDANPIN